MSKIFLGEISYLVVGVRYWSNSDSQMMVGGILASRLASALPANRRTSISLFKLFIKFLTWKEKWISSTLLGFKVRPSNGLPDLLHHHHSLRFVGHHRLPAGKLIVVEYGNDRDGELDQVPFVLQGELDHGACANVPSPTLPCDGGNNNRIAKLQVSSLIGWLPKAWKLQRCSSPAMAMRLASTPNSSEFELTYLITS